MDPHRVHAYPIPGLYSAPIRTGLGLRHANVATAQPQPQSSSPQAPQLSKLDLFVTAYNSHKYYFSFHCFSNWAQQSLNRSHMEG